jgi:hypothetical protein
MAADRTLPLLLGGGLLAYLFLSRKSAAAPSEPVAPASAPPKDAPPPAKVRDEAAYKAGFENGGIDAAASMNEAYRNIGSPTVASSKNLGMATKGTDLGDGYQDGFVKAVKVYADAGFRIEGTADDLFAGKARVVRDKITTDASGRYDGENDAVDSVSNFDPAAGSTPALINNFRPDMRSTPAEKGYRDGYAAVLADNKPPFQLVGDLLSGSAEIKLPAST